MKRFLTTFAVLAATLVAALGSTQEAAAINPTQTTEAGLVNLLASRSVYGSIDEFWARTLPTWGLTYYSPGIYYYGGAYGSYSTPCGATLPNNGFYCSTSNSIYLDYPFMQRNLERFGDFHPGAFLAHEWGHRIQHHLGTWFLNQGYRSEYHADCLTGLYTRYGYTTGRLNGNDYWEGHGWLFNQPQSTSHGYGPYRAAWYEWGYKQYSRAACDQVFSAPAGTATSSASSAGQIRPGDRVAAAKRILPPAHGGPVDISVRGPVTLPSGGTSVRVKSSRPQLETPSTAATGRRVLQP